MSDGGEGEQGAGLEVELPPDHLDVLDPVARSQTLKVDRIYIAVSFSCTSGRSMGDNAARWHA